MVFFAFSSSSKHTSLISATLSVYYLDEKKIAVHIINMEKNE